MLHAVSITDADKIVLFRSALVDKELSPLLHLGIQGRQTVLSLCSTAESYFGSREETPDDFEGVLLELLTCWRGWATLLDASNTQNLGEASSLVEVKGQSDNDVTATRSVSIMLSSIPYYK